MVKMIILCYVYFTKITKNKAKATRLNGMTKEMSKDRKEKKKTNKTKL